MFEEYKNFIEKNKELIETGSLFDIAKKASFTRAAPVDLAPFIFTLANLKNDFSQLGFFVFAGTPTVNQAVVMKEEGDYGTSIPLYNITMTIKETDPIPGILRGVKEFLVGRILTGKLADKMPKEFIQPIVDNIKVYLSDTIMEANQVQPIPGVYPRTYPSYSLKDVK